MHELLRVGGVAEHEIVPRALDVLQSGAAYERFVALVEAQGGSRAAVERIAAATCTALPQTRAATAS